MAVMVSVPKGRMWWLVTLAVQPRAAGASVAATAGEGGLFGGPACRWWMRLHDVVATESCRKKQHYPVMPQNGLVCTTDGEGLPVR